MMQITGKVSQGVAVLTLIVKNSLSHQTTGKQEIFMIDPDSPSPQPSCQAEVSDFSTDRIDFFSALEKFVELSQETRARSFSHSRMEELGGGRSESCRLSVVEVAPSEATADDQRSSSLSNTPHASEESSIDEEQSKVKTVFMVLCLMKFSLMTKYLGLCYVLSIFDVGKDLGRRCERDSLA